MNVHNIILTNIAQALPINNFQVVRIIYIERIDATDNTDKSVTINYITNHITRWFSKFFLYHTLYSLKRNSKILKDTASLKVDCKLSVKYGTFKLNLNVNYDNKGYQLSNVKTYNSEQSVTFLSSNFKGMSTLRHNLEKKVSGLEDQVEVGFLDVYDLIVDSYKTGNKEEFKENVEYLYETIGPVVITGAYIVLLQV